MSGSYAPAQTTPPGQMIMPAHGSSALVSALLGQGGSMPQSQNPLAGVPLSGLLNAFLKQGENGQPSAGAQAMNGIGSLLPDGGVKNWLQGYDWNGGAGAGSNQANWLGQQATNNTAGGAAGL